MKTQNRARHHNGRIPCRFQSALRRTSRRQKLAEIVTIPIYDKEGGEWDRLELPRKLYTLMCGEAARTGQTPNEFFNAALWNHLLEHGRGSTPEPQPAIQIDEDGLPKDILVRARLGNWDVRLRRDQAQQYERWECQLRKSYALFIRYGTPLERAVTKACRENAPLAPLVREFAGRWSARKRLAMASTYAGWAAQLRASVQAMGCCQDAQATPNGGRSR